MADKHTLILVRHGESTWNLKNVFTGWYDCPLSPKGHEEVIEAGNLIKAEGLKADVAFTSLLQRAIRTLWHVLEQTGLMWIPVHKAWQVGEDIIRAAYCCCRRHDYRNSKDKSLTYHSNSGFITASRALLF